MQFPRSTRGIVALAALALASACGDAEPLPLAPAQPEAPAPDAGMAAISRGLALALAEPSHRAYLLGALQASTESDHRVSLGALVGGEAGVPFAEAVAARGGLTPAELARALDALPALEVYFPSSLDRIEWPVSREIVVLGSLASGEEFAAVERRTGFGARGEPVEVALQARNAFAVLLVRPAEPTAPRPLEECSRYSRECFGTGSGGGTTSWGYSLTDVSWSACTSAPSDDHDADGISDGCEFALAHAFRPILMHNRLDGAMTKEPYWTVRPDGTGAVQVMYLLSYHFDPGEVNTGAYAHYGDIEFIIFRIVNPNYTATRWYIDSATLSAHWGEPTDATYSGSASNLEYSGSVRGRPNIWVARSKHANYASRASCNWGAWGMDTCVDNDVIEHLDVRAERNIGNTGYGGGRQLRDCVASSIGGVNRARIECFFSGDFFGGWITHATASNSSGPYRTPLRAYLFMGAGAGIPIDEGPCDPYAKYCG